jgi:hypothetical protein
LLHAEFVAIREELRCVDEPLAQRPYCASHFRRDIRRQSTVTTFLLPVNDDDRTVDDATGEAAQRRRSLRASDLVAGAAVGGLLALVVVIAWGFMSRRHTSATLTLEALRAAQQQWQSNGPSDYQMDVVVKGRQPSRYRVEVAAGQPTQVLQNDREIPRRNWSYWTVPGLFDIIEHDMECSDDPTRGFGARPGSTAVLRAEFDARTGYPHVFERLILGEPQLDMTWEVTRFEEGATQ